MKGIGERVKTLRLQHPSKLSQQDLADLSDVNIETINRIEHDHNTQIDSLLKIANALKVKVGDLLPEDQRAASQTHAQIGICREHLPVFQLLDVVLHAEDQRLADWICGNIDTFHKQALVRRNPPEGNNLPRRAPRIHARPSVKKDKKLG
jgi:transcriptional regulator with XRE-family HTH domain